MDGIFTGRMRVLMAKPTFESGVGASPEAFDDVREYAQDLEEDTIRRLLAGISIDSVQLAGMDSDVLLRMRDMLVKWPSFVRLSHETKRAAFRTCMIELFLRESRVPGE